jgi:hypothetical protein
MTEVTPDLGIGDELTGFSYRRAFKMPGERLPAAAGRLGLPLTVVSFSTR